MQRYQVANHADSLLPEGKQWKLVWSDEFDGAELDKSKWDYRLEMMGKRHVTWTDEGVTLDGKGNAIFRIYEKDGEICSSQLQTGYNFMDASIHPAPNAGLIWPIGKLQKSKFLHTYGYYECRCKLQRREGWWSAFWLQSPLIGASLDPAETGIEVDVMESFHPGDVIFHANHFGGYGADHVQVNSGAGAKGLDLDEYHLFGVAWGKDGYTYYIDGKEDGHADAPVSACPQFILISTEVNGYRSAAHAPTPEARLAVGDEFIVDSVRVFDEIC